MRRTMGVWVLALALGAGCGSDDRDRGGGAGDDAGSGGMADGGTAGETDAGGAGGTDAGGTAAAGRLEGVVTRTAEPRAGGIGHLYIAVFDRDPVTNRDSAVVVARTLIENADMSDDAAEIPYSVEEVPPRAEPYFVTAFLDDDGDAGMDPETAGPDMGDLVVLEGLGSPQVTVSSAETVSFDIVLNTNLPF